MTYYMIFCNACIIMMRSTNNYRDSIVTSNHRACYMSY